MEARENLDNINLVFKFQFEFGNDLVVFKTTSIESVRLGSVFSLDAYICFVPVVLNK